MSMFPYVWRRWFVGPGAFQQRPSASFIMVCCDTFKLYQKIAAPAVLDIALAHVVISVTLLIDCSAQLRAAFIHAVFFFFLCAALHQSVSSVSTQGRWHRITWYSEHFLKHQTNKKNTKWMVIFGLCNYVNYFFFFFGEFSELKRDVPY